MGLKEFVKKYLEKELPKDFATGGVVPPGSIDQAKFFISHGYHFPSKNSSGTHDTFLVLDIETSSASKPLFTCYNPPQPADTESEAWD